ncbi:MAG TPA: DNA polymerase IV [Solirubrobacterales bacterium]|nr:DNA polymerase IV [Solirubrobacterales bacterium]
MHDWPHVYLHVDMDAFYVSVELLRQPRLRGKPVIVATGTDPHARGVVMTASYEARKFGVHSALPLSIAHRRCPEAVLIPRDMELYKRASKRVMEVLGAYSDTVEVAGLDEAYLELSDSPAPKARARDLKQRIRDETRLTCSVGIAPNKLMAKIASDLRKPDGLCVLDHDGWLDAVGNRPAALLPGVGPRTEERLAALGIGTVRELAKAPAERLERSLGPRLGASLRDTANGRDDRPVTTERAPKSESRETTFAYDVSDRALLRETLDRFASEVGERLARDGYVGRTVTMKIRLRPFRTHTRSRTLPTATNEAAAIRDVARDLLDNFELDAPVRLLGVGMAGLTRVADAGEGGRAAEAAEPQPLALDLR